MTDVGIAFLERSRRLLTTELYPRITSSVTALSEEDVWWRPNEQSNSIGNLLLHLAGNVRQWVISGIGGATDERRREEEFERRSPLPPAELLGRLEATLAEAVAVLERVTPEQLVEMRSIQGRVVSVFDAVYHVVEHFSMHTGQIIYIAKLRLDRDLHFYEMVDGVPFAAWERGPQRSPTRGAQ